MKKLKKTDPDSWNPGDLLKLKPGDYPPNNFETWDATNNCFSNNDVTLSENDILLYLEKVVLASMRDTVYLCLVGSVVVPFYDDELTLVKKHK